VAHHRGDLAGLPQLLSGGLLGDLDFHPVAGVSAVLLGVFGGALLAQPPPQLRFVVVGAAFPACHRALSHDCTL
jgi:hypothetical protein